MDFIIIFGLGMAGGNLLMDFPLAGLGLMMASFGIAYIRFTK